MPWAGLRFGRPVYIDEEYSLNVHWLTPAKAAMIFRFAPSEMVEECAQLFPPKGSFSRLGDRIPQDGL